jgi:hypothetical protein
LNHIRHIRTQKDSHKVCRSFTIYILCEILFELMLCVSKKIILRSTQTLKISNEKKILRVTLCELMCFKKIILPFTPTLKIYIEKISYVLPYVNLCALCVSKKTSLSFSLIPTK